MSEIHTYCSYCGSAFVELGWPRHCATCENTTYRNPIPVMVVLLPVDDGLLTVRRGIPPKEGELALPGGFLDFGESWQEGASRELEEETGIQIAPEDFTLFDVMSPPSPSRTVLIFCSAPKIVTSALPPFQKTNETTEQVILTKAEPLAFPLHTDAVRRFFG